MKYKWKSARLGDICTIARGGSPRPIQQYLTSASDGINWIKIGDVAANEKYITNTAEKIKPSGVKKSRMVKAGDFILSNSMSFGRPYILKIDGCIHDGWLVIQDNDFVFNKDYLYHFLSSPSTYRTFKSLVEGGVVSNLNSEMVRNLIVPIPKDNEQQQIATELDRVYSIIEKQKKQLLLFNDLTKSKFHEMFFNQNKYLLRVKLEDVCSAQSSNLLQKDIKNNSGKYPIYGASGLISYVDFFKQESPYIGIVKDGAGVGRVMLLPPHSSVIGTMQYILPKPNISPVYLYYVLVSLELGKLATGATIPHIYFKDYKGKELVLPDLIQQQQFANFVTQVEESKEKLKSEIQQTETLYKALMQKYFG